jgi:predicted XRE-type DNA-binding protein
MVEQNNVHVSCGNIFEDLDLPDAQEMLVKAELARKIGDSINYHKLTQAQAAKILGIDQPKVSALVRGKLAGFSTDRLLEFLSSLGNDIEIIVKPKPEYRQHGRISVVC